MDGQLELTPPIFAHGAEFLPFTSNGRCGADHGALTLAADAQGDRTIVRIQQFAVLATLIPLQYPPPDVLPSIGVHLSGALQNQYAAHLEAT
ncbi:MAG TPA: hypothetical protein DIC65_05215 [Actinobacteria bacterium]|nr:hypothetical protein [Actinomycetota bacterium]